MGGDEGNQLMFFPGLMPMRQGSTGGHVAYSLPGFPQLPMMMPGAYTCARPGYAYAQAHAYAYPPPPPPPGTYAYPPQGYPYPAAGSPAPHQLGHGSSGQKEAMESIPKATYGGISHGSGGHGGGRRQVETAPKSGSAATASATAYGGNGSFGFFGNCCGCHNHRTSSFNHAAGHGHHSGKFKSGGHRPGKVEHVHGKFRAKRTTWKY